jgi:hypothetical protein
MRGHPHRYRSRRSMDLFSTFQKGTNHAIDHHIEHLNCIIDRLTVNVSVELTIPLIEAYAAFLKRNSSVNSIVHIFTSFWGREAIGTGPNRHVVSNTSKRRPSVQTAYVKNLYDITTSHIYTVGWL